MQARLRSMRENDGFTLIELLVVMIIIGILAAIAIPAFLAQRAKARDAATQNDIHNVATMVQTYGVNHADDWTNITAQLLSDDGETVPTSSGTTVYVVAAGDGLFCLAAMNSGGSPLPAGENNLGGFNSVIWWWDNQAGGLQPRNATIPANETGCPSYNAQLASNYNLAVSELNFSQL